MTFFLFSSSPPILLLPCMVVNLVLFQPILPERAAFGSGEAQNTPKKKKKSRWFWPFCSILAGIKLFWLERLKWVCFTGNEFSIIVLFSDFTASRPLEAEDEDEEEESPGFDHRPLALSPFLFSRSADCREPQKQIPFSMFSFHS